jgi:beta-glucosidase
MTMKKYAYVLMMVVCGSLFAQDKALDLAQQTLAKMTLEEKLSLCAGNSTMTLNALPRVGIMNEFWMSDGPHNVRPDLARQTFDSANRKDDFSTAMPTLTALAATWDVGLATKFGNVIGEEARDRGKDMMLGPGVNIMRTPVCGRNFEYMTEDPALAAQMVVPFIRAVQSHDVASCVKHFAVNSQELERNTMNVEVDERALREIYLPAFRATVQEAKVLTVMNAYNKLRGVYCSHSDYLNNQILRKEWGFKGFVVTDWGSMHDTLGGAFGGTDVEMNAGKDIRYFKAPLAQAVKEGKVPASMIDEKALRILYVMAKIGFLDGRARAKGSRNTPEHHQIARAVAEQGIVLLKNDKQVLPFDAKALKTVVVLGKNAITKHCGKGWSAEGKPLHEVTPLEGIKEKLGNSVKVIYAPLTLADEQAKIQPVNESCINTFDTHIKDAGMTVRAWKADYFANMNLDGAPAASGFERKLNVDWKSNAPVKEVKPESFSVRWTAQLVAPESGLYQVGVSANEEAGTRITIDGKVVVDNWKADCKTPFATTDVALEAKKEYSVVVEYRKGKSESTCTFGWQLPSERGMSQAEIEKAVKSADAVIAITGTEHGHGRALECEGGDRPNLLLPIGHDEAIQTLLTWRPDSVIVHHSGAPSELPWASACATLVQDWYGGQEAGRALAAVLFGDVNPSGKMPHTVPMKLADTPAVMLNAYNATNVTYAESIFVGYRWYDHKKIAPLFPFGHGLSYTTFVYDKPVVTTAELKADGTVEVSIPVANTGKRDGKEIVQLYVSDLKPAIEKPVRELKHFTTLSLKPGETQRALFVIAPRDLSYYSVADKKFRADAGEYAIEFGASSRDIRQKLTLRLASTWFE